MLYYILSKEVLRSSGTPVTPPPVTSSISLQPRDSKVEVSRDFAPTTTTVPGSGLLRTLRNSAVACVSACVVAMQVVKQGWEPLHCFSPRICQVHDLQV